MATQFDRHLEPHIVMENHCLEEKAGNSQDDHWKSGVSNNVDSYRQRAAPDTAQLLPADNVRNSQQGSAVSSVTQRRSHEGTGSRRIHTDSVTQDYYGDSTQLDNSQQRWNITNNEEVKKITLKQSRRIPGWVWFIIAKLLGIKLHQFDKPWFGTLVYVIMLVIAALFVVTSTWHGVYDISSNYTKTTLLMGLEGIIGVLFWCSLGIYAMRLSGKLLSSQKFADSVRMHSKTVFKISSAALLWALCLAVICINDYHVVETFGPAHCEGMSLDPWVCRIMYVSRVIFSVFALLFNSMVGFILLSVCRTHTIGIRRFIRELEEDGKICDQLKRMSLYGDGSTQTDELEQQYLWDNEDILPSHSQPDPPTEGTPIRQRRAPPGGQPGNDASSPVVEGATSLPNDVPTIVIKEESPCKQNPVDVEQVSLTSQNSLQNLAQYDLPGQRSLRSPVDSSHLSMRAELSSPRKMPSSIVGISEGETVSNFTVDHRVLGNEDILFRYWKIQNKLVATSLCLQRWFVMISLFILIWSVVYIISWLGKDAKMIELAEFVIPLMILPLLASAYAEVNYECTRILKAICPVEERIQLMKHMREQPLEMTAFGISVSYSTIVTALAAVALAFSSRLIMDEISKT